MEHKDVTRGLFENVDSRFFDYQKRTDKEFFDMKTRRLQPLEEVVDWCKTSLTEKEFLRDIEERFTSFEKAYKQEYAVLSLMASKSDESAKEQLKQMTQMREAYDFHLKKASLDLDDLREMSR